MSSPAQNLVEQINDWEFIELWVDPIVFPPRILMLVGGKNSKCCIYDPSANYKLLFLSVNISTKGFRIEVVSIFRRCIAVIKK